MNNPKRSGISRCARDPGPSVFAEESMSSGHWLVRGQVVGGLLSCGNGQRHSGLDPESTLPYLHKQSRLLITSDNNAPICFAENPIVFTLVFITLNP